MSALRIPGGAQWPDWRHLATDCVSLGIDKNGRIILLKDRVRFQHTYILGKSGTGKSVLIGNIVAQDFLRGASVVYVDAIGTGARLTERLLGSANFRAMAKERTH